MTRVLIFLLFVSLSGAVSAQATIIHSGTATPGTQSSAVTTVAAETRAQEEFFAAWKVRYANNRAKVVQEINAVKQEITGIDPTKAALKQELTNLLSGTVRRWNEEKTDYADPDQFADCQALFTTIRQAIHNGTLNR